MKKRNADSFIILGVLLIAMLSPAYAGSISKLTDSPLPVWETAEESALRAIYGFPQPESVDAPPVGSVQSYAEWAPSSGVIVSWMGFPSFLASMVQQFVQVGTSWIVVESTSQQASVESTLQGMGIPLDNVEFLIFNMDTVWTVDYGPFFVNVDGNREIVDNIYDRYGRWEDDQFPSRLATAWSLPVYESDLRIEGGNFIADGAGVCFITDRVIEQNSGYLTEQQVYDRLRDYCGCETIHVLDRINDGTGHIDMFAKLLDEDTMLLGQYDPGDPEYSTLENNATAVANMVAGTGNYYEVIRIPMPGSASAYWTYTNSIIVNDHVFVPIYQVAEDATALQIYQDAMPDHTIVGIDSSDVIGSGGAVHCTTKVVPTGAAYSAGLIDISVDDSSGDQDQILDPGETAGLAVTLKNSGLNSLENLTGTLSCTQSEYVSILNPTAAWPDLEQGDQAANLAPNFSVSIDPSTPESTELQFQLQVSGDNYLGTLTFTQIVSSIALQYSWNLDSNPGWTCEGDWEYGQPTGGGGDHGSPDPASGYTGSNVYGYNLEGDYAANMNSTMYLTTESMDCSALLTTELRFYAWLGVEQSSYDHASVQVSNDGGSNWTTLWENSATQEGGSWIYWSFDVSDYAAGHSNVKFRWGMGPTDNLWHYCGWNIDDLEIWGASTDPQPTSTPTPTWTPSPTPTSTRTPTPTSTSTPEMTPTATPFICLNDGDVDNTGSITPQDALMAFQIYLSIIPDPTEEEICSADCNGSGAATPEDALCIFVHYLSGDCSCADTSPLDRRVDSYPSTRNHDAQTIEQTFSAISLELLESNSNGEFSLGVFLNQRPEPCQAFGLDISCPVSSAAFVRAEPGILIADWEAFGAHCEASTIRLGGFDPLLPIRQGTGGMLAVIHFQLNTREQSLLKKVLKEIQVQRTVDDLAHF